MRFLERNSPILFLSVRVTGELVTLISWLSECHQVSFCLSWSFLADASWFAQHQCNWSWCAYRQSYIFVKNCMLTRWKGYNLWGQRLLYSWFFSRVILGHELWAARWIRWSPRLERLVFSWVIVGASGAMWPGIDRLCKSPHSDGPACRNSCRDWENFYAQARSYARVESLPRRGK